MEELTERVRKVAQGAALMTETTLEENFISGAYNMLSNGVLSDHMMKVLEELGPIEFTDDEVAYGKTVASAFPVELRTFLLEQEHVPADLLDAGLLGEPRPISDRDKVMPGSTDVSDVSWITPTAQITTTTWALGIPGHSWAVTATGAMTIGHKGMLHAAKAMAITGVDLIQDPALLQQAREEFAASTNGRPYQCPIPPHVQPRRP